MSQATIEAEVDSVRPLTNSILQLILKPSAFVSYQAGQYLQIMLKGTPFSYSIANAPLGSHTYELHIRHTPDNPYNEPLLENIRETGHVELSVPHGDCHMQVLEASKPTMFIAAGTGFAPIKAMIEQQLALGGTTPFELYWSARSSSDLYYERQVNDWYSHVPSFDFFQPLTGSGAKLLSASILARHPTDLSHWQFVLAGPFDMVYKTRDHLLEKGAKRDQMYSDAFSFE